MSIDNPTGRRGAKVKRARMIIGRAGANRELPTAEVERRTTQIQVILMTSIMAMTRDGHMLVASDKH
ncbi:MAG: hypothetical protein GEU26_13720 [Nitrososphaeraceae archaeon]|nr:hypothetical protein [Nitrososphaeraceae archaeon]